MVASTLTMCRTWRPPPWWAGRMPTTRTLLVRSVVCLEWLQAVFNIVILVTGQTFDYFTRWALFVFIIYVLFPRTVSIETPIFIVTWAILWAVAIGISLILAFDYGIMADAEHEYGQRDAHLGNVIMHYTPPLILIASAATSLVPRINCHLRPSQILAAMLVVYALSYTYTINFKPHQRYKTSIPTLTLFCALALAANVSVLLLLSGLLVFARRSTAAHPDPPHKAPSA